MNNKTTTMKFTTMGNAKKITGLSYLGSVASSSKIANVVRAARQASGLPVYECECKNPRAVSG